MAFGVRLTVTAKTRALVQQLSKFEKGAITRRALKGWAPEFLYEVKRASPGSKPGNTGTYRRGYTVRMISDFAMAIINPVKWWLWVEENTRAHIIRPVNALALAFRPGKGAVSAFRAGPGAFRGTVFTRVVHHPGTKGQHVLRNTLKVTGPMLVRRLAAETRRELGGGV